jgi:hypothetical protein
MFKQENPPIKMMSFVLALPLAQGYADLGLNGYNRFAEAVQQAQTLGLELSAEERMKAIAPAMVLAFAIEAFFKVLVFQRTGKYPRGHELKKMIRKLPADCLTSLERRYSKCVERPGRPLKITFRIGSDTTSNSSWNGLTDQDGLLGDDFETAVKNASPLFDELRYLFENVTEGFSADIDFSWLLYLLDAIRWEVLDFKEGEIQFKFAALPT